ncbi:MAG TPA: single-stranded-DNA-specific exonuclease RecJ [Chitinophagaceae bacterium]|nr:single-stranded-DNA-specific exonuclease RecJ [Chitinophagaceae bacterium]MCC6634264.1 single-stranded-DNA-specific exonuclease RecJ [Chitinophagaceae bacterium]HNF29117.1 single-stranded-DNA-specific exonuclease RecJ [Chitinophagaceae bacterium]HNJ57548.1 single-stranded-DNA-specific exonuclease RecJ [Chitinophagaceae bacterium]HNM34372.1 single-stranded-DNA-specific exonuclease RecJ [Chitinophagaceae bacterium]
MQKNWKIVEYDKALAETLQKELKINKTICKILVSRGIDNYTKAKDFFRPTLEQLHSPWLMKDMDKATQRIIDAINKKEKILVYGDYDVDGTTSVACMYSFLKAQHPFVDYYIPHRYKEGYGVSKAGIDFAAENNFSLIITLDCGIKSVDLINYAATLHLDFIVCDHHMPDKILPNAIAILNAKQKDCNYPFKELCGCGVGFKLMQAIAEKLNLSKDSYLQFVDLVAIAIAADIVPITGENRTLAYFGVKKVNENPNIGIKALISLAALEKSISINNLVFIVAPRINAAGRMDDAKKAVQLFIETNVAKALEYAEMLHVDNKERKEADSSITEQALNLIKNNPTLINKKTTVVYNETWHKGVVGIVASRLIETYYKPTIVLTKSGNLITGSARSVVGYNLYDAIYSCKNYLTNYGGHFAAAGLSLLPEQLENFTNAFETVVSNTISPDLLIPEIIIDAELAFDEITTTFYNIIMQMEPFGPNNMRPVFISRNVIDTGFSKIVKEQHLKISVKQNNIILNGIGFNMANKFSILEQNNQVDIVYTIDQNEWNGEKILQLKLIDLKPSK